MCDGSFHKQLVYEYAQTLYAVTPVVSGVEHLFMLHYCPGLIVSSLLWVSPSPPTLSCLCLSSHGIFTSLSCQMILILLTV